MIYAGMEKENWDESFALSQQLTPSQFMYIQTKLKTNPLQNMLMDGPLQTATKTVCPLHRASFISTLAVC